MDKLSKVNACSKATYEELSQLLMDASSIANWLIDLDQMDNFNYAFAFMVISKMPTPNNRAWERKRTALQQSVSEIDQTNASHLLKLWEAVKSFLRNEVMMLASEGSSLAVALSPRITFADTVRSQQHSQSVAAQAPVRGQLRHCMEFILDLDAMCTKAGH